MQLTREQVCELTARKLRTAAAEAIGSVKMTVGLDGFVESSSGFRPRALMIVPTVATRTGSVVQGI